MNEELRAEKANKALLIEDSPEDARLIRQMLADAKNDASFHLECVERLQSGLESLPREGLT